MFTCLTSTALSRHFGTGKTYRVIAVWPKSHKHKHSLCRFQVFLYHTPDKHKHSLCRFQVFLYHTPDKHKHSLCRFQVFLYHTPDKHKHSLCRFQVFLYHTPDKHKHSLCRFQVFLYHALDCSCGYSTCSLKVNKKKRKIKPWHLLNLSSKTALESGHASKILPSKPSQIRSLTVSKITRWLYFSYFRHWTGQRP